MYWYWYWYCYYYYYYYYCNCIVYIYTYIYTWATWVCLKMGYYHERTIVIGKLMVHHAKFGVPYFQTTQYHQLIVSYIS